MSAITFCRPLLSLAPLIVPSVVAGQLTWQRTYGGFGADEAVAVVATADSGYVMLGSTGSFGSGGGDLYLVRVDSAGSLVWSMTYGGPGVEQGADLVRSDDEDLLIVGTRYHDPSFGYDGFLVRTDQAGTPLWERPYGQQGWDLFHAAASVPGGWFVVGQTFSVGDGSGEAWILRITEVGDTLWTRTFGSLESEVATAVVGMPDGGCAVVVNRAATTGQDIVLVRYASDGVLLWQTTWGGVAWDEGRSVTATTDGGFVVGGVTEGVVPYRTMLMIKFDAAGAFMWNEVAFGQGTWEGYAVIELQSGDLCLAGSTDAFGAGGKDMYMWHTTATGAYIEGPTFGGLEQDEAFDVVAAVDGGYVLVGRTNSAGPGPQAVLAVKHFGSPLSGTFDETLDPLPIPDLRPSTAGLLLHPNPARPGDAITMTLAGGNGQRRSVVLLDQQGRQVAGWPDQHPSEPLRVPSIAPGTYTLHTVSDNGRRSAAPLLIIP